MNPWEEILVARKLERAVGWLHLDGVRAADLTDPQELAAACKSIADSGLGGIFRADANAAAVLLALGRAHPDLTPTQLCEACATLAEQIEGRS